MNMTNGIGFAIDTNVHIEVIDSHNIIRQQVDKHNRATHHMLEGILSFLRGDFNASYRQLDENRLRYKDYAKNYIPCYINLGVGGVVIDTNTGNPSVDEEYPRKPRLTDDWVSPTNIVKTSDSHLAMEIGTDDYKSRSRVEIAVLSTDNKREYGNLYSTPNGVIKSSKNYIDTDLANSVMQFVFSADAPTGHCNIYGAGVPAFITEVGLFATPIPGNADLLARVILKKEDEVLYVRPQDTVVVTWVISIIAIDDQSFYGLNDENVNDLTEINSIINENITATDINIDI